MLADLPSPSRGVWHLGGVPLRAYALTIILGIVAEVWIGDRRGVARGGRPGQVFDVAGWQSRSARLGGGARTAGHGGEPG